MEAENHRRLTPVFKTAGRVLLILLRIITVIICVSFLGDVFDMASEALTGIAIGDAPLWIWVPSLIMILGAPICTILFLNQKKLCAKAERFSKVLPFVVSMIVVLFFCLFLISVKGLAARHMGTDLAYANCMLYFGICVLINALTHAPKNGKPLAKWLILGGVCLALGFVCIYIASITPCCTGG